MISKLNSEQVLRSEVWGTVLNPSPNPARNVASNSRVCFRIPTRSLLASTKESLSKKSDDDNFRGIVNGKESNSLKTSAYIPMSQRYRPFSFEELVGQNLASRILRNSIKSGRIRPAYLFSGPRGTGKTSAARIFAAALNCTQTARKTVGDPCGCCRECLSIKSGTNIDVREVDAASNSGVDSMRSLLESVRYAPVCGKYKVYIIDECHMLSSEAEHALLKTLEEPPPFVVFILVTTDPQRMLRTVKSRCEPFKFQRISDRFIIQHMRQMAIREEMTVEEDALQLMAQLAEGSLRDATSMLDQLSLVGDVITPDVIQELMGVVSDSEMILLLRDVLTANQESAVRERVEKLFDFGAEPSAILSHLVSIVMNLLTNVSRVTPPFSSVMSDEEKEARSLLVNLAGLSFGKNMLRCALSAFSEAEKQIRASPNPHLWLQVSLLQLPLQLKSPNHLNSERDGEPQLSPQPAIMDDSWNRPSDLNPLKFTGDTVEESPAMPPTNFQPPEKEEEKNEPQAIYQDEERNVLHAIEPAAKEEPPAEENHVTETTTQETGATHDYQISNHSQESKLSHESDNQENNFTDLPKLESVEDEIVLQGIFDQAVNILKKGARYELLKNEGRLVKIANSQVFLEFPEEWAKKASKSFYKTKYTSVFQEILGSEVSIKIGVRSTQERDTSKDGDVQSMENILQPTEERDLMVDEDTLPPQESQEQQQQKGYKVRPGRSKTRDALKSEVETEKEVKDKTQKRDRLVSGTELTKSDEGIPSHPPNDHGSVRSLIAEKNEDDEKLESTSSDITTGDEVELEAEKDVKEDNLETRLNRVSRSLRSMNPSPNQTQAASLSVKTRASSPSRKSSGLHESNTSKMWNAEAIAHKFASAFDGSVYRL